MKLKIKDLKNVWMDRCLEKYQKTSMGRKLKEELSRLNPGKVESILLKEFLWKKIKISLIVFLTGIFFLVLLGLNWRQSSLFITDGKIIRNEEGKSSKILELDAKIEDKNYSDIVVEIMAKEYTEEEIVEKANYIFEQLPELIKGKNSSLNYVSSSLNLINSYEDFPIDIRWETDNFEIINQEGILGENISEDGEVVHLTAICEYGKLVRSKDYEICVFPKIEDGEEAVWSEIQNAVLRQEEKSRENQFFKLPDEINGKKIIWSQTRSREGFLLAGLIIIVTIAVFMGKDQEVHKNYKKRNQELLIEYAKFVSQLQILIGSGMSIRSAILKLGSDYKRKKERSEKTIYIYEELLLTIKMIQSGSSDIDALDYFAKRSELMCYRKIVSLISQNMKRGTNGLKRNLKEEVRNAFEERKLLAKRLGEEAETKLLLPMMIMMGIVLIIIITPAYFSFGGI